MSKAIFNNGQLIYKVSQYGPGKVEVNPRRVVSCGAKQLIVETMKGSKEKWSLVQHKKVPFYASHTEAMQEYRRLGGQDLEEESAEDDCIRCGGSDMTATQGVEVCLDCGAVAF